MTATSHCERATRSLFIVWAWAPSHVPLRPIS